MTAFQKSAGSTQLVTVVLTITVFIFLGLAISSCMNVDFPCEWYGSGLPVERDASTRIVYCLSRFPSNASGGYICTMGSSGENKIAISPCDASCEKVTLEKRGENLLVDDKVLRPEETYTVHRLCPTTNPLFFSTMDITITNDNMFSRLESIDAIYAIGDIKEGVKLNLLVSGILVVGIVVLGVGSRLLIREWKRRRTQ